MLPAPEAAAADVWHFQTTFNIILSGISCASHHQDSDRNNFRSEKKLEKNEIQI